MHRRSGLIIASWAIACATYAQDRAHACAGDGRSTYPPAWFQDIPREGAPTWEILPQDAGPCEVVLSKRTELGILSNFAPTAFVLDGVRYASLEGFWQMMKFPEDADDPRARLPDFAWPHTRAEVGQMTAFAAKDAGSIGSDAMRRLNINWVTYQGRQLTYRTPERGDHYQLILRATRAKLDQNPEVRAILLRTGDLTLKPDHVQETDASPAWKYFEIWTQLRAELRAEDAATTKTH